ncbi:hypothetical protein JCM11641_005838 [Rhodosporidiobolus odoratus]
MSDVDDSLDHVATSLESAGLLAPSSAGWQLAMVLYGMYLVVHGRYVSGRLYKKAMVRVKALLWVVFVLLTCYIGLIYAEQIQWTTATNRNVVFLLNGTPFESFPPLFGGFVAAPVQTLLMLRTAALLPKNRIFGRYLFLLVIGLGILLALGGAVATCAINLTYFYGNYDSLKIDFNAALSLWLWTSCIIDVLISAALACTLKQRVAGFNEQTDGLLKRLIQSAMQTAAYTSVLALVGAITATVFSEASPRFAFVNYAFWAPLPCCYGLSLYTTLSTRRTVEEYIGSSIPLPGSAQYNSTPLPRSEPAVPRFKIQEISLGWRAGPTAEGTRSWINGKAVETPVRANTDSVVDLA